MLLPGASGPLIPVTVISQRGSSHTLLLLIYPGDMDTVSLFLSCGWLWEGWQNQAIGPGSPQAGPGPWGAHQGRKITREASGSGRPCPAHARGRRVPSALGTGSHRVPSALPSRALPPPSAVWGRLTRHTASRAHSQAGLHSGQGPGSRTSGRKAGGRGMSVRRIPERVVSSPSRSRRAGSDRPHANARLGSRGLQRRVLSPR